jgi:hypothetical protein
VRRIGSIGCDEPQHLVVSHPLDATLENAPPLLAARPPLVRLWRAGDAAAVANIFVMPLKP